MSELVASFVRALQPDYVVETGTCIGQTAWLIAQALQCNGQGHLDTIETEADRAKFAAERLTGLPALVHCTSSMDFTPREPIGFAWFDSRVDLRVAEFERYRPHFLPGAIAGFHDTAPHQGAWGRHVESLPGTRAIRLPTPRGVTFVEVLS